MRILTHVNSLERRGGVEVNTLEVTSALAALGHEVHVLYGHRTLSFPAPDMRADFEAAGITLHGPFPFTSSLAGALSAIPSFVPAANLVARLRPDVLWLQRFEHIVWGQTAARRARVPLVAHLHHMPNFRRAVPLLGRGVSRFLAVSAFTRGQWVDAGLDARRVDVVPNAVPVASYPRGGAVERSAAREGLGLAPDVPTALYYGHMVEQKGLRVALDAWDHLGAPAGDAHLVLAGEPAERPDPVLASRIAALVRDGRATVLPTQRDVTGLLHAADVVLFPTLLQESFGRVALEALMTERPVLASDIGGVPEILSGPLARLLVPPGDAAALGAGLSSLLAWRRTDPELGRSLRAEAAARFDFDAHVTAVEDALRRASGSRRATASR